jgi:regulator of chromosome condensation
MQTGLENIVKVPSRTTLDPKAGWKRIASAQNHTLALSNKDYVYVMGHPEYGKLGLGRGETRKPLQSAKLIPGLKNIVDISCYGNVSYAVDTSGRIWAWGMASPQLGLDDGATDIWKPTALPIKNTSKVTMISAGGGHTAVVAYKCAA